MAQFKIMRLFCLLVFLMAKFKGLQSEELVLHVANIVLCFNSSLRGIRLNAPVFEVRNVSSKSACVDDCFFNPCCRSLNYNHAPSLNHSNKCELLHELVENTSYALEPNSSFDHIFFDYPLKDYNSSCIPEEVEKAENKTMINRTDICSSSPCLNNGSCVRDGSTRYRCICLPGISGINCEKTYNSCKELLDSNSSIPNGRFYLKLDENSEIYPAYCHMLNLSAKCGGGGWTLVMKLDRDKTTFKYDSSFWTNKKTLNVDAGLDGLTQNETKLASYYNTPFNKVCLGMTRNNVTKWMLLNCNATSLYSVITDPNYQATNVGRAEWMSLINDAKLYANCSQEGFNVKFNCRNLRLRIGITNRNRPNSDCDDKRSDSLIGFGIKIKPSWVSEPGWIWSSGNINKTQTLVKTFGYIFVQ